MESKGVSKYELDHHGPWCQRDGAVSARLPDGRAERAKSRSVNMARIVAQRAAANRRKRGYSRIVLCNWQHFAALMPSILGALQQYFAL